MRYTTEDAAELYKSIKSSAEHFGPEYTFENLQNFDPELLALTLVLSTLSR